MVINRWKSFNWRTNYKQLGLGWEICGSTLMLKTKNNPHFFVCFVSFLFFFFFFFKNGSKTLAFFFLPPVHD